MALQGLQQQFPPARGFGREQHPTREPRQEILQGRERTLGARVEQQRRRLGDSGRSRAGGGDSHPWQPFQGGLDRGRVEEQLVRGQQRPFGIVAAALVALLGLGAECRHGLGDTVQLDGQGLRR